MGSSLCGTLHLGLCAP